MASEILLINFTPKEAERLESLLPIKFNRGYLGELVTIAGKQCVKGVLPPVYEHCVTVVNMRTNKQLDGEFDLLAAPLEKRDVRNLFRYWEEIRGVLIVLLGDHPLDDMLQVGIPEVLLADADDGDRYVEHTGYKKSTQISKALADMVGMVRKPLARYIERGDLWLKKESYETPSSRAIYVNKNGDNIAVCIDAEYQSSSTLSPMVLLLPQFSDNVAAMGKLLKGIAADFPGFLPEIRDEEWASSDMLYPAAVADLNSQKTEVLQKAKEDVERLEKLKQDLKGQYDYLPKLLTANGEELKQAVLRGMRDILSVQAVDADEQAVGPLSEDIMLPALKVLAEVKGTNKPSPPVAYITQVWKHLHQKQDPSVTRGALILNHDLGSDPSMRPLAYAGKNAGELEDIIFIDTRELHKALIAVIDGRAAAEEVVSTMFKNGRYVYGLQKSEAAK